MNFNLVNYLYLFKLLLLNQNNPTDWLIYYYLEKKIIYIYIIYYLEFAIKKKWFLEKNKWSYRFLQMNSSFIFIYIYIRGGTAHRCLGSVRTSVRGSQFDTISVQQGKKNLLCSVSFHLFWTDSCTNYYFFPPRCANTNYYYIIYIYIYIYIYIKSAVHIYTYKEYILEIHLI